MKLSQLYAPIRLGESVIVGEHCTLGYPKEAVSETRNAGSTRVGEPVVIGDRSLLFNQVVVNKGTTLGADCVLKDRSRISYGCVIGDETRVVPGAYVCDRVQIGEDACGQVCAESGTRTNTDAENMPELLLVVMALLTTAPVLSVIGVTS